MSSPLSYLGTPDATTTIKGKVELATIAETTAGLRDDLACTPAGVAAVAIAGAPAASVTQAGIIELATNAEAAAQSATDRAITPSNLPSVMAAAGAIGGSTPAVGTFTSLTANGTGTVTLTSNAASVYDVTGAGNDLTLSSDAGRVYINGEEAAADAVRIESVNGGLDVDVGLLMSLVSSRNNAQAILINASAGGIDITAAGAAGEDIDIVNTAGSVNISAGEAALDSIVISSATGGIDISAAQDIDVVATGASIVIQSTESAADSIKIESTTGGIDILASGAAAGEDIDIIATGSSVNITSTENAAQAIYLRANGGVTETVQIHADQGTAVNSVNILSDVGGVTITGGVASADAVNIVASNAAGGIDVDAGTAGVIVDTTGAISLDSAAASNFTVTGAFDLTVNTSLGSLNLSGGEDAADAVVISAGAGGIDVLATGAAGQDIDIVNTGGSVNISATESAADSVTIVSTAGGIDILASGAAAGEDIDIIATGSSVNIQATEAIANAITINASNAAGGVDISTGGGSIDLSSAGSVTMVAGTDTQASPTATATINKNVFAATFTGFTTASAASQTFTITNSVASTSSQLLLSIANEGANDAQMTIQRVKRLAGSIEVYTKNNGAAALNGNVTITGWIIG